MNFYDPNSKKWRQLWLDDRGQPIDFIGEPFDKGIRFAEAPATGGTRRMTFTRLNNGDIEQLIEQTKDGGKTHTIAFKGIYKRKK